ncbi:polyamine ABC transporter, permease protein [Rhodobacteraceae bacterium KLH11]|nr:polyamine ABC transporter, permease protein [Rhodobacteraceae bacterium KLH11]
MTIDAKFPAPKLPQIRRSADSDFFNRWARLFPSLFIIGFFMLAPILVVGTYSFLEADPYGGVRPNYSSAAYAQLVFEENLDGSWGFNPSYVKILWRSILIAGISTALCLIVGFPVAYYMARQPVDKRNFLVLLITIPFWTNLLIRTYCWILILRDTGLVNNSLISAGILDAPFKMLYTNGAILLGLVYTFVPFMILPIYASVERLDLRLLEAGHDLYATRWQVMREIILPLAKPGIIAGSILVFIPCIGAFIAPDLLGGSKKLMIGSLIQLQFSSSRNWPFGAAVTLVLLAFVLIVLMIYAMKSSGKKDLEAA